MISVCERGRDEQISTSAVIEIQYRFVETWNHLAPTGRKLEWFAADKGIVKRSDFIYEMDLAYSVSDVVVSRAGALSVSELCLVGKPSILVPFPFAAEDHQTQNAMALVNHNAALFVKDENAKEELTQTALRLLQDPEKQQELAKNIKTLAKPNAALEMSRMSFLTGFPVSLMSEA